MESTEFPLNLMELPIVEGMELKLHGPLKPGDNVGWRWKPSLVLALKDGVCLLAPVITLFRRIRWDRASISLTSETRCFPIRPGREERQTERGERHQTRAGAGIKRAQESHRSLFRLIETKMDWVLNPFWTEKVPSVASAKKRFLAGNASSVLST